MTDIVADRPKHLRRSLLQAVRRAAHTAAERLQLYQAAGHLDGFSRLDQRSGTYQAEQLYTRFEELAAIYNLGQAKRSHVLRQP